MSRLDRCFHIIHSLSSFNFSSSIWGKALEGPTISYPNLPPRDEEAERILTLHEGAVQEGKRGGRGDGAEVGAYVP